MSALRDFLEAEVENREHAGGDESDYLKEARDALEACDALIKAEASAEKDRVRLWNDNRDLRGSIDAVNAACESLRMERDAMAARAEGAEKGLATVKRKLEGARADLAKQKAKMRELRAIVDRLSAEAQQATIAELTADAQSIAKTNMHAQAYIDGQKLASAALRAENDDLRAQLAAVAAERDRARKQYRCYSCKQVFDEDDGYGLASQHFGSALKNSTPICHEVLAGKWGGGPHDPYVRVRRDHYDDLTRTRDEARAALATATQTLDMLTSNFSHGWAKPGRYETIASVENIATRTLAAIRNRSAKP